MQNLIENQFANAGTAFAARLPGGSAAGCEAARSTPPGGIPARVRRPLAPTPCSILALLEAGR